MPLHVTDDGCALAFSVEGPAEAPALVLSNSLGTDRALWDSQIAALADRFRVLRYDTRGHGESTVPAGGWTIDRLGRDVLSLMDAAEMARASVCGISLGGMTALWLGIHAPERVERLVLANTGARIGSDEMWTERIRVATTEGLAAMADAVMMRWFTELFRVTRADTVAACRAALCRTSAPGYAGACEALRHADLRADACHVTARCLVIAGAHDVATPPALGTWLADTIPSAEMVTLDAAHLSNVERPAEFNHAVVRFLSA